MSNTIQEALKLLDNIKLVENLDNQRILDIFEECKSELARIGYPIDDDIKLKESSTTSRLADIMPVPDADGKYILRISKYMYESSDEVVKDTILHELAHYLTAKKALNRGIYIKDDLGYWTIDPADRARWTRHGDEWKKIINYINLRLGTELAATGEDDEFMAQIAKDAKYEVECTNCHNKIVYFRKNRFIKSLQANGARDYECPECGKVGMFKFIKNKDQA